MEISILAINGSAKKDGNTAKLLNRVLDHAKKEAKVEIIHLIEKNIKPCISCCFSKNDCQYPCRVDDDMKEIFEKIKSADCLILASPTYWYSCSGLMKNFIDRLTAEDTMKVPIINGKVVGFVSTAYMDGSAQTISQMFLPLSSMGAIIVPCADVFSNHGKVWRSEFDIEVEKRLARNLIKLTELTKKEQGKWI